MVDLFLLSVMQPFKFLHNFKNQFIQEKVIIKGLKTLQVKNGLLWWMMDVRVKAEDEGRVEVK